MDLEEKPVLDNLSDHNYCIPNSQNLVPKQKEIDESEAPNLSSHEGEYPEYIEVEPFKSSKTKSHFSRKRRKQTCVVCFNSIDEGLSGIGCKNEQLVLLTGMVLRGKKRTEDAKSIFCASMIYACPVHLSEAVDAIFEFLNVTNLDEMKKCSSDHVENLMVNVKKLSSQLNFSEFCIPLEDLIQKCKSSSSEDSDKAVIVDSEPIMRITENSIISPLKRKTPRIYRRCSVCKTLNISDEINNLRSKFNKLPAVVGIYLGGQKTIDEARRMFDRPVLHLCKVHEKESINSILKFLNIESIEEIQNCSIDDRMKLVGILNSLQRNTYPRACFQGFSTALDEYIRKYK